MPSTHYKCLIHQFFLTPFIKFDTFRRVDLTLLFRPQVGHSRPLDRDPVRKRTSERRKEPWPISSLYIWPSLTLNSSSFSGAWNGHHFRNWVWKGQMSPRPNACIQLLSGVQLFCDPMELSRLLCPWDFQVRNTTVGCHFLLQRIFYESRNDKMPQTPGWEHRGHLLRIALAGFANSTRNRHDLVAEI